MIHMVDVTVISILVFIIKNVSIVVHLIQRLSTGCALVTVDIYQSFMISVFLASILVNIHIFGIINSAINVL